MFGFANPEYLYLLFLLPVIAGLFLLAKHNRARKIAKFGRPEVVNQLMPEQSQYKPWIRLGLELLILAVVIVILARPRGGAHQQNVTINGVEVMICLDVSNSMRAASDDNQTDISRLQRSKLVLEKLIDKLQGNKVGLVIFAGNSYMQMPLTSDAAAAKMFLNDISTDMVPTQGTAIGSAINMAVSGFSNNPKSQKTIIVITDGENFEDDAQSSAKEAAKNGVTVNVVGIGSTNGAPIPLDNGQFMADENGKEVFTALNEADAQKIAKAGKGAYVNGSATDAVNDLYDAIEKLAKSDLASYTYSQADELFPVFAWIAFILIIAEMLLTERKNPLLKKYQFFTKKEKK